MYTRIEDTYILRLCGPTYCFRSEPLYCDVIIYFQTQTRYTRAGAANRRRFTERNRYRNENDVHA